MKPTASLLIIVLTILASTSGAADGSTAFFDNRTAIIMGEYLSCTGDSTPLSTDSLIRWKNTLNNFVNSPQYAATYAAFVAKTGMRENVTPCYIMNWAVHNRLMNSTELGHSTDAITIRQTMVDDSQQVAADLRANRPTPFDFAHIPLGVTIKTFKALFAQKYDCRLEPDLRPDGMNLAARDIRWGDDTISAVFHFGGDRFRGYELESAMFPPDSLDMAVRPIAGRMTHSVTARTGEPDRLLRVGFFDIVQNRISPLATWRRKPYSATVGLGTHNYRYYARLIVSKE